MDPFITTDDLGAYIHQTVDSADPLALAMIDAGCQIVRDYLGQTVNLVTNDEIDLNGSGSDIIILPQLPVVDLGELTIGDDLDTDLVATEDVILATDSGIVYRVDGLVFPIGRLNIHVIYDHGWAAASVPGSIRLVATELAAAGFVAGSASVGGLSGETIGSYSYTVSTATSGALGAFTDYHRMALDSWRMRRP